MVDQEPGSGPLDHVERAATADLLEASGPGYLDHIRRATARLSVRAGAAADARAALADVEQASRIDVDVPTASAVRAKAVAKDAAKRLVGWYLNYLGQQVTVLGQAAVRLGGVLVERTEELQAASDRLRADVDALSARVDRLERDGR